MSQALCDVCKVAVDFRRNDWRTLATGQIVHYSQTEESCYERNLAMAEAKITRVSKWFSASEYGNLLTEVKQKCTTERQLQFVDMLTKAFDRYGVEAHLTPNQKEWLKKVRG